MALNFQASAPTPAAGGKNTSRPEAQAWLNVGITVPMPQEDGSTQDVFVSLPFGLAVDTMEPTAARGNNAEWHQMVQAKNWLLAEIQKMAQGMTPGQEEIVTGLQLQLKRVGKPEAINPGENPFLKLMAAKLAA